MPPGQMRREVGQKKAEIQNDYGGQDPKKPFVVPLVVPSEGAAALLVIPAELLAIVKFWSAVVSVDAPAYPGNPTLTSKRSRTRKSVHPQSDPADPVMVFPVMVRQTFPTSSGAGCLPAVRRIPFEAFMPGLLIVFPVTVMFI